MLVGNKRTKVVLLGMVVCVLVCAAFAQHLIAPQQKRTGASVGLKDGDIVFQYSGSEQCAAIAQATRSPYTHCGIIFLADGRPEVWEAVGPVRRTPYAEWVRHGVGGHAVVKRLKDASPLTAEHLAAMRAEGQREMGRPYDIWFDMDDARIYCSELVWKIFDRGAGLHIAPLERFGDMDFSGNEARRVLKERFGDAFPADRAVITPAGLFRSALLYTVDSIGTPPAIP